MSNIDERLKSLFQVPVTSEIKGSKAYYEKVFHSICSELMSNYDLCFKRDGDNKEEAIKRYDLLEVESYFKTEKYHHNDPYTHNHPIQYKNGLWYFHHMGKSSSFKGGTRKGVDITLGRIENNNQHIASGGILIRAIQCQTTQKLIEGPSLLVDTILKELGYTSLQELVTNQFDKKKISGQCWDPKSGFFLAPKEKENKEKQPQQQKLNFFNNKNEKEENNMDNQINKSCRVGLGLKNRSPSLEIRLDYVCRPYRFTKKTWLLSKGKIWTILTLLRDQKQHHPSSKKLNIKSTLMKSCQLEYEYGVKNSAKVIESCLLGKDILEGGLGWKIKVMSAILFREDQLMKGNKIELKV